MWLVAGDRYLQCDGLAEVGVLDGVSELGAWIVALWPPCELWTCLKKLLNSIISLKYFIVTRLDLGRIIQEFFDSI